MKKIFIFVSVIVIILFFVLVLIAFLKPAEKPSLMDCLEFGVCAEGTKLENNGKEYFITKEYCIKNNFVWIDKYSVCDTRKSSY